MPVEVNEGLLLYGIFPMNTLLPPVLSGGMMAAIEKGMRIVQ